MTFAKAVGKSWTNFSVHMDRFIGERASKDDRHAHFLSVFGGDAQIAAAHAIISEEQQFSVEGPGLERIEVGMGKDAQCYRASIQLSTSKRPLRHLIAVSKEFGEQVYSDTSGRTLLVGSTVEYLWTAIAQIFGLPALPQWAVWFYQKLCRNLAITELYGLGCRPFLVTGTKREFLEWLSTGIRRGEIKLPEQNGPAIWPSTPLETLLSSEPAVSDETDSSLQ